MRLPRHPFSFVLSAAAILLALQAAGTWLLVERDRADTLADSGEAVVRLLASAEANINRGLLQVDALLAGLDTLVPVPGAPASGSTGEAAGGGANRALRALSDQSFLTRDLMIVSGGRVRAASQPATLRRPPPLPDDFVSTQGLSDGTLHIGDPVRNRATGEWSLFLGRIMRRPGSEPAAAVAELPLMNLTRLALPNPSPPGLRVSVERVDGQLLMSTPHDELRIGRRLPPIAGRLVPGRQWAPVPSRTGEGRVIAAAAPTLYGGLLVVVELNEEDALASWRERRGAVIGASLVIALFLILAVASAVLYVRAREQSAAAVRRTKRLLDQALDAMNEGFVLYDADQRLVLANRRYYEMFPYLRDVAVPGTPTERIARHAARAVLPTGSEEERRAWIAWRLDAHNRPGTFEQALPGGLVVESTQAQAPDGTIVCVHRDVTTGKQTEARLAEAKEAAERAHRMKSEFLSNMSHELRTPLNAIIGFAQVLENSGSDVADAERREYARDIRASGEHLLAIINDVLDMSKLEAGAMALHETDCDLGHLAIRSAAILREQARLAGVTLHTETPEEPLPVRADERLIRQVVLNLVSNAVKFTGPGGSVGIRLERTGDGALRIVVSDTGCGIMPEHVPKVFEPFYQVDNTAARRRGGTGLGLPISLAIVRMHQGSLDLDSVPGRGTTATVTLPASRCRPACGTFHATTP